MSVKLFLYTKFLEISFKNNFPIVYNTAMLNFDSEDFSFENKKATVAMTLSLPTGEDIYPYPGENTKNSMVWKNWNKAFDGLQIHGLQYVNCWFVEGHYWYAYRDDTSRPMLSRSQAIVSKWTRENDADISRFSLDKNTESVTAYFPVYDGIGFWIGKQRREKGISNYSQETEKNIAIASALSVLKVDPQSLLKNNEALYQCVWAPGKVFDQSGQILSSPSNFAFRDLGYDPCEISKTGTDGKDLNFKLFGLTAHKESNGFIERGLFTPTLAEELHPAWKQINSLPYTPGQPNEGDY